MPLVAIGLAAALGAPVQAQTQDCLGHAQASTVYKVAVVPQF